MKSKLSKATLNSNLKHYSNKRCSLKFFVSKYSFSAQVVKPETKLQFLYISNLYITLKYLHTKQL